MNVPGFHTRQASKTGIPGLIGLVLLFSGMLLAYVGVQTLEAFSRPQIPATFGFTVGIVGPTFFLGDFEPPPVSFLLSSPTSGHASTASNP